MKLSEMVESRRYVLNRLLFAIMAMTLVFSTGFIAGGISSVSKTLVEPYHFGWTVYCGMNGGEPGLCSCAEKEMVNIYGSRDPKGHSRYADPTVIPEALSKCVK
jgi:hypothetical protein